MKQSARSDAPGSAGFEFDYLVVGAGSAGCAIASRLADDPTITVALLEAGPTDHHFTVSAPLGVAATVPRAGPRNYAYHSVPQPGLNDRRSYQPRGRGLGGSSSINGMVYIRGHRNDFDDWAKAGCDGWSYVDVLPYFRRSECNERYVGRDDNPWHGGHGPLHVSELRSPNPFSRRFVEAALQAGLALNHDFNGAKQEGVGFYQVTQHNGERWNTARAYLHRGDTRDQTLSGGRRNLVVFTEMQVLKILFDGKRACGVSTVRDGRIETLRARREIVLSAGAFNSPQLLMTSGVGPADHLRSFGIEVVHALPGVGKNLQDHLDIIIKRQVQSTDLFGRSLPGVIRLVREIGRYRRARRGMVTSNLAEAGGFVKSRPELDVPDLQLHFVPALLGKRGDGKKLRGHGYSCHACVLRPHSRGEVRLDSADTRDVPIIDPRFLSDERDMDGMVAGVRIMQRIFAQRGLAGASGSGLSEKRYSESETDTESLRDFIRNNADTVYHPVGTCKMGTDSMAVVDPSLRVRGVDGLRVVDASVMPTLIGGNTNAAAIMIAEKAVDLIKAPSIAPAYSVSEP